MVRNDAAGPQVRPRIRILCGNEIALGPGKAELLAAIAAERTIAGAARRLGMSYMRAWSLVRTMNQCFRAPLIATARGGSERGTAELTAAGRKVLVLYRRMESASLTGLEPAWRELRPFVRSTKRPKARSQVR